MENTIKFDNGITYSIGQKVKVIGLSYNGHLTGKVIGFGKSKGLQTVKVKINNPNLICSTERHKLAKGGFYDRALQIGVFGGELLSL